MRAHNILGSTLYLTAALAMAQASTPEEQLHQCMLVEIEKYQPVSRYSQEFRCSVGNKQPFESTPSRGPYPVSISLPGYVFLTATARETFKISDGGYTPPYITPRRDQVTSTLWCRAENKVYGKSGKFYFVIEGERQRVATPVEKRKALQHCTKEINGLWNHN